MCSENIEFYLTVKEQESLHSHATNLRYHILFKPKNETLVKYHRSRQKSSMYRFSNHRQNSLYPSSHSNLISKFSLEIPILLASLPSHPQQPYQSHHSTPIMAPKEMNARIYLSPSPEQIRAIGALIRGERRRARFLQEGVPISGRDFTR